LTLATEAVALGNGGNEPTGCAAQLIEPGEFDFSAWWPANRDTNIATSRACWPTTTFCGM
jgi:hypothetical protein